MEWDDTQPPLPTYAVSPHTSDLADIESVTAFDRPQTRYMPDLTISPRRSPRFSPRSIADQNRTREWVDANERSKRSRSTARNLNPSFDVIDHSSQVAADIKKAYANKLSQARANKPVEEAAVQHRDQMADQQLDKSGPLVHKKAAAPFLRPSVLTSAPLNQPITGALGAVPRHTPHADANPVPTHTLPHQLPPAQSTYKRVAGTDQSQSSSRPLRSNTQVPSIQQQVEEQDTRSRQAKSKKSSSRGRSSSKHSSK